MKPTIPLNKYTKNPSSDLKYRFILSQKYLTSVKVLSQITQSVQHHRGASLAYLSGDRSFENQLNYLKPHINLLLDILINNCKSDIPSSHEKNINELNNQWQVIVNDWGQDKLMHNFEFHSYLVEKLHISTVETIANLYQLFPSIKHSSCLTVSQFEDLLIHVENLAKLRGLSTNAAIVKACVNESSSRISFLLKEIPRQQQALIQQFKITQSEISPCSTERLINQHQKKLQRLLISIQLQIIETNTIVINGSQLFDLASIIIDSRWSAFHSAIYTVDQFIIDNLHYN